MIKALAGGGGRGMRIVSGRRARGRVCPLPLRGPGRLRRRRRLLEQLMPQARHLEVQIVGDGQGGIVALGERGARCSGATRSSWRSRQVRRCPRRPVAQSCRPRSPMATAVTYRGLATFGFLVSSDGMRHVFIEANPRLQVERTVTEMVTGVDLVVTQLRIAGGATLAQLGLEARQVPTPPGSCDPGPDQHGDHVCAGGCTPRRRHADRLRSTRRSGRAGRYLRPGGLHRQPELRLAAGQAGGAFTDRERMPTRSPRPGGRWRSSASKGCPPIATSCCRSLRTRTCRPMRSPRNGIESVGVRWARGEGAQAAAVYPSWWRGAGWRGGCSGRDAAGGNGAVPTLAGAAVPHAAVVDVPPGTRSIAAPLLAASWICRWPRATRCGQVSRSRSCRR
jgi:hypothetical protein